MSARSNILGAVAALLAGLAGIAQAQVWQPFGPVDYRHDFAPFETFDIKNMSGAPDPQEGFFFTFEKLNWAVQGENNTLGNPDVVVQFPDVLTGVDPPRVFNGITESAPEATFGWGERYEFGYVVDHHGWTASVLDGPEITDSEVYGFIDEIYVDEFTDPDTTVAFHPHPGSGNVVILFDGPPNLLRGYLFGDTDGDGQTDTPVDINQDGLIDLDDTILFLTSFDQVTARNHTQLDGVELMKTYRFKPTHRGSVVEFGFGARYLRLHDNFRVDAHGGILNDLNLPVATAVVDDRTSFWDTTVDNHVVGPQVALRWSKRQGRFTYSAAGRFTFGYNVQDHDQTGQIGTALDFLQEGTVLQADPPIGAGIGADGQPMLMSNTAIRHGKQEQDFSPLVEFRTEMNYHLTQDFALKLGFNATFIDNVRRAAPSVAYVLPNMGFRDVGTQEIFTAGVNFGAEFNR